MESTGKYWVPVFNLLEEEINVTIANTRIIRIFSFRLLEEEINVTIANPNG